MDVTIVEIAKMAGVSVSTVSRVVNGNAKKYRISDETAERVMSVATKVNYRPNFIARGLRLKHTKTIGLIIPDISNPFFAYVTRIIQTAIYKHGYSLIVCNTDENLHTEMEQIELLRSKGVDGFIILPVGIESDHIRDLLDENIPMVLLDRCFQTIETNSVVVDNSYGAYVATEHLIGKGHERIAIIQGLTGTYTSNERLAGYQQAMADNKIGIRKELIVGNDFRRENGYIETKFLLNMENRPTAIFATGDLITLGALQALFEENVQIPEEMSIVAFDDFEFAPFLVSPLTAVSQPRDAMGQIAVKLLIEDIKKKGKSIKQRIVLKPRLNIRQSVCNCNGS